MRCDMDFPGRRSIFPQFVFARVRDDENIGVSEQLTKGIDLVVDMRGETIGNCQDEVAARFARGLAATANPKYGCASAVRYRVVVDKVGISVEQGVERNVVQHL